MIVRHREHRHHTSYSHGALYKIHSMQNNTPPSLQYHITMSYQDNNDEYRPRPEPVWVNRSVWSRYTLFYRTHITLFQLCESIDNFGFAGNQGGRYGDAG